MSSAIQGDYENIENLSGVISTLVKFANDLNNSLVTDLGLHTFRIFFDFFSDFMIFILFEEKKLLDVKLRNIQVLMKGTLSDIKDVFMVHLREQPLGSPDDLVSYRDLIDRISDTIDQILYDSFKRALRTISN